MSTSPAFLLPLAMCTSLFLVWLLWYLLGRDPKPDQKLIAEISLDRVPAGLAGLVLKERYDDLDILASVLDLGSKGILKIEESCSGAASYDEFLGETRSICKNSSTRECSVKIASDETSDLLSHQKLILDALKFNAAQSRFSFRDLSDTHSKLEQAVWKDEQALSWFENLPVKIIRKYKLCGAALAFLACFGLGFSVQAESFGVLPLLTMIAATVLLLIPMQVFARYFRYKEVGLDVVTVLEGVPLFVIGLALLLIVPSFYFTERTVLFDLSFSLFFFALLLVSMAEIFPHKTTLGASVAEFFRSFLRDDFDEAVKRYSFSQLLPYAVSLRKVDVLLSHYSEAKDLELDYFKPWFMELLLEKEQVRREKLPVVAISDNIYSLSLG